MQITRNLGRKTSRDLKFCRLIPSAKLNRGPATSQPHPLPSHAGIKDGFQRVYITMFEMQAINYDNPNIIRITGMSLAPPPSPRMNERDCSSC